MTGGKTTIVEVAQRLDALRDRSARAAEADVEVGEDAARTPTWRRPRRSAATRRPARTPARPCSPSAPSASCVPRRAVASPAWIAACRGRGELGPPRGRGRARDTARRWRPRTSSRPRRRRRRRTRRGSTGSCRRPATSQLRLEAGRRGRERHEDHRAHSVVTFAESWLDVIDCAGGPEGPTPVGWVCWLKNCMKVSPSTSFSLRGGAELDLLGGDHDRAVLLEADRALAVAVGEQDHLAVVVERQLVPAAWSEHAQRVGVGSLPSPCGVSAPVSVPRSSAPPVLLGRAPERPAPDRAAHVAGGELDPDRGADLRGGTAGRGPCRRRRARRAAPSRSRPARRARPGTLARMRPIFFGSPTSVTTPSYLP